MLQRNKFFVMISSQSKPRSQIVFEATQHRAFADRKRKQAGFEIHVRAPGPGAILQAEVHTLVRLELL